MANAATAQASTGVEPAAAAGARRTARAGTRQIDRDRRVRRATTRSLLARPLSEPSRTPRSQPLHHSLVWHSRAFRCLGISAIELCDLVSVCVPRGAVECRKFRDQLRNGHAELGRSDLKHVRSSLVDLDADVGIHATRIADPKPSASACEVAQPASMSDRGHRGDNLQVESER